MLLCPVVYPADTDRAKQLICTAGGVKVRDVSHAAVMLNNDVHEIATFDPGFDVISELHRLPLE
jgi:predicted nucleic acid-binding protein